MTIYVLIFNKSGWSEHLLELC